MQKTSPLVSQSEFPLREQLKEHELFGLKKSLVDGGHGRDRNVDHR